jgi:hypothetical protein
MRHMRSFVAGAVGVGVLAAGAVGQDDCPLEWTAAGVPIVLPPLMVW